MLLRCDRPVADRNATEEANQQGASLSYADTGKSMLAVQDRCKVSAQRITQTSSAVLNQGRHRTHHAHIGWKEIMRKILRYPLVALLALVSTVATSLTVAAPAQAYDTSGSWRWVSFNSGTCNALYGFNYSVGSNGDYCVVDGISYKKDPGGVALYATYTVNPCCNAKKVFRVEWHPNGERLRVCDLAGDGDTIYARLAYKSYNWYYESVLGTSAGNCKDGNYSYIDGTEIYVNLYDNSSPSDFMAGFYNLRA